MNLLQVALGASLLHVSSASSEGNATETVEPSTAVLFPWFSQVLGLVVMYGITRWLAVVPYTAALFVLGTFMGVGLELSKPNLSLLGESIDMWTQIDSEVLLLVFLPGLLFGDAFNVDTHLFGKGIWQVLLLAFPCVLLGTFLTSLVAYYIFPFGWSFTLCLTLGAILSATDPVAVMALLEEVGAPPRLQVLIGGESMLNDGSSIVFFTIFSGMALTDLGVTNTSEISVSEGFAIFFQMSLGGACIGLAFSLGLTWLLWMFDRKLSKLDVVMQTTSVISIAYLSFFTAEIVAETSGVIAVVVCGIFTRVFGGGLILDPAYLDHIISTVEHLLNSLLFLLAGSIWGSVLANQAEREGHFEATEWGYLILLYLFLLVIRAFLLLLAYPILIRMGLKTNWRESVFMCWAGVRGAVGLALAIALDNSIYTETTPADEEARQQSSVLFAMVGGIAFLTLIIQGTSSPVVLRLLGLTDSSRARLAIVQCIAERIRIHALDRLIQVSTEERHWPADFGVIQGHASILKGVTLEDIDLAVKRYREETPPIDFKEPNVEFIRRAINPVLAKQTIESRRETENNESNQIHQGPSYRRGHNENASTNQPVNEEEENKVEIPEQETEDDKNEDDDDDDEKESEDGESVESAPAEISYAHSNIKQRAPRNQFLARTQSTRMISKMRLPEHMKFKMESHIDSKRRLRSRMLNRYQLETEQVTRSAVELREVFLSLLQTCFSTLIRERSLAHMGLVDRQLVQALQISSDHIAEGEPLRDWEILETLDQTPAEVFLETFVTNLLSLDCITSKEDRAYRAQRFKAVKALAFIDGHRMAEELFRVQFMDAGSDGRDTLLAEDIVLKESQTQVQLARRYLETIPNENVQLILSHLVTGIILVHQGKYVEELEAKGILKTREAGIFLETIQADLAGLHSCGPSHHQDLEVKPAQFRMLKALQKSEDESTQASDNASWS